MNLNQYFILTYAYDSWYYKQRLMEFLIERYEELKKLSYFPDISEPTIEGTKPIETKTVLRSLKIEYFASCLHITETFFALMWAIEKDVTKLWKLLAEYRIWKDLEPYIETVANGIVLSDEIINKVFYANLNLPMIKKEKPTEHTELVKNFENIKGYISRLAKWYIRHKNFYNSYKHGLRFLRTTLTPIEAPEDFLKLFENKDLEGIFYITSDSKLPDGIERHITVINYDRLKKIHSLNYHLIRSIIFSLRQRYKVNSGKGSGQVQITLLKEINLDEIFPLITLKSGVKFEEPEI